MPRMRNGAAFGLVAVLAGCNQIWGNDPVERWDAQTIIDVEPDAPLPTARLELLVAMTDANGAATNVATVRPLDPAPTVQVGRVDGALTQATYNEGAIEIPADYPGTPWRLVYTPAGDVPHELHWAPAAGVEGRAVMSQFGGVDRGPVPANASYRLTPNNPGAYNDLHVYTTGVWATGVPSVNGTVATMPVTPTDFKIVSGPFLAPDSTLGDHVVLVDYQGTFPCQYAQGAAVFKVPLTGPDSAGTGATWTTPSSGGAVNVTLTGYDVATASRIADRYGPGLQPSNVTSQALYGYGTSTVMPMFVTHYFASSLYAPVMIPVVDCVSYDPQMGTQFTSIKPAKLNLQVNEALPMVANVQLNVARLLPSGLTVHDGLTGAIATTTGQTMFNLEFPVGIPLDIQLGGQAVGGQHVMNEPDHVVLPDVPGTLDLTFTLDSPVQGQPVGTADYATATLYRADTLVRVREYTFTGPSDPEARWTLRMDREVLDPTVEYVIELRTFTGAPGARMADFTRYTAAQSSATRWTRTFKRP
jgi:hypothetical protein